jgi:hypothetical protein
MTDRLLSEYETMMNVGLGAQALWAFAAGYHEQERAGSDALSLWHVVTVLPLVFHSVGRRTINRRHASSGLRSVLARDANNDVAQNEVVFDLTRRIRAMQPRTMRSLNCAVAWGLVAIDKGAFFPAKGFRMPRSSQEGKDILKAAHKLGRWAGEMTTFEYLTILGVDVVP